MNRYGGEVAIQVLSPNPAVEFVFSQDPVRIFEKYLEKVRFFHRERKFSAVEVRPAGANIQAESAEGYFGFFRIADSGFSPPVSVSRR